MRLTHAGRGSPLDTPFTPLAMKMATAVHVSAFRATGGRIGGWAPYPNPHGHMAFCLITTTGRKTGKSRVRPLTCLLDGDNVVLVASQGGLPRHPHWYLNLTANPEVVVELGLRGKRGPQRMLARTATAAERAELWPRVVRVYRQYEQYQSWTDREIPVVICEPIRDGDGPP